MIVKPAQFHQMVGKRLRALREKASLSPAALAAAANVNSEGELSVSALDIIAIEQGRHALDDFYLPLALAECLGATINELAPPRRFAIAALDQK